jgi:large subunit ribosomal protein L30e
MVDVDKILKNTVKKGKVRIGIKESIKAIQDGKAHLIVIAKNCPKSDQIQIEAKQNNVPVYQFESNSVDLGYTCGKSYAVSTFAVLDDGGTNLVQLMKKR